MLSSRFRSIALAPALALAAACGSSPPAGPAGGPVPDAASTRCIDNGMVTPAKVGACLPAGSSAADAGAAGDGGADAAPATSSGDYGETLYNSSGYDDDCKYHLSFTSTPIRKNANVTFTVTVEQLDPAGPATGAAVFAEVFLNPIHTQANSDTKTTETPPGSGVYNVGPIVFDASGIWTVRFHMYEMCSDQPPDSPHGHAAFYVEVP
jgi:hypothetical protein